ncbi:hypothetical protein R3I93_003195 [Phoxinus phoxinus]|uniref:Uncharacterized protein n=1 Tax=Phoxinus phoxinus TaxID=58324 RepID=A0AAN9HF28_9TELE
MLSRRQLCVERGFEESVSEEHRRIPVTNSSLFLCNPGNPNSPKTAILQPVVKSDEGLCGPRCAPGVDVVSIITPDQ